MSDVNAAFTDAVRKHAAGDAPGAEAAYRALLAQYGSHAPTLCNLGVLLVGAGKIDEAEKQYSLALATDPGNADAHFNLGNLYRRTNQLGRAAEQYQHCLAQNPEHASAAFNFGLVLSAVGELAAAIEYFQLVVRLEPTNAEAHGRLGDTLLRFGKPTDGIVAFRKSVELKPNDPRGLYNLGLALSNVGQTKEAHDLIQKALKLNPNYAEAHNALGLNLEALGQKDDALFRYQKAVELKPDLADAWSNLGTNLAESGRSAEALNCLRESLTIRPNAPPIHSNLLLLLNYSSAMTPSQVTEEHLNWAKRFAGPTPDAPAIPEPHDPNRRLKIGYLSADFRSHTVSGFIEALLMHHNRSAVEVHAYPSVIRPDDATERLKGLADQWRPVGGIPDDQAVDIIRADKLDCLIDLGGHTAGNRLLVMAARPAPVSATLFGYPNTTGLTAVDYRITDAVSDPPGETEALYAEKLLRLPEVPWLYFPPVDAPVITPLPGATQRFFTFGCLNNAAKISDLCLETWAKILQSIPGTRLVLLGGQSSAGAKRLTDRFVKAGVLRDRVEVIQRLSKKDYFAKYLTFDLSLDPFPYNGGVTTGDSLWMGVPVLTVAGNSYVSRQGVMAMTAIGQPQFVANSPAELLTLAKSWTTKRPELATIRSGLRERVKQSPLADAKRYVGHLEAGLRAAWRERLPKNSKE